MPPPLLLLDTALTYKFVSNLNNNFHCRYQRSYLHKAIKVHSVKCMSDFPGYKAAEPLFKRLLLTRTQKTVFKLTFMKFDMSTGYRN
jgi:hypothetical protein